MPVRRFELVDDKSAKFWEITQEGAEYTVCFGKIGTKGQAKTKTLVIQDAAISEVAKLIKEKIGKGYVEVGADSSLQNGVETGTLSIEMPLAIKTTKVSKAAMKSKTISKEHITKIRNLIESKTLDSLKMAIHLLQSLEATHQDWADAFNSSTLIHLCEIPHDLEIYILLVEAFKSDDKLMVDFVNSLCECYVDNRSCVSYSLPEPEGWNEDEDGDWTRSSDGEWWNEEDFLAKLIVNNNELLQPFTKKFIKKLNKIIEPEELELDEITNLTCNMTELVGDLKCGDISLSGLTDLSETAARVLSTKKVALFLNGLTILTDTAAESLSKHKGELYLNGLNSLSDAAAESLSKHKGHSLDLTGLTSLSDTAAESLSKYKGHSLDLSGLTSLSDELADILSKYQGQLRLRGLVSLSNKVAESLSKSKGKLHLLGQAKAKVTRTRRDQKSSTRGKD